MTALQNKIVEIGRKDGVEDALIKGTALSVAYYGVENEVEVSKFIDALIPPIEIVDD